MNLIYYFASFTLKTVWSVSLNRNFILPLNYYQTKPKTSCEVTANKSNLNEAPFLTTYLLWFCSSLLTTRLLTL